MGGLDEKISPKWSVFGRLNPSSERVGWGGPHDGRPPQKSPGRVEADAGLPSPASSVLTDSDGNLIENGSCAGYSSGPRGNRGQSILWFRATDTAVRVIGEKGMTSHSGLSGRDLLASLVFNALNTITGMGKR